MSYSNRSRVAPYGQGYRQGYDFQQAFQDVGKPDELRCELCDRAVPALTAHHLIPRQKTKRKNLDPGPTIQICSACHRQIHVLYDNSYLAKELSTLEKLQQDPKMQRFIAWVRKQDPGKRVQVDRR